MWCIYVTAICDTSKKSPDEEPIWWDEYLYAILAEEWYYLKGKGDLNDY